MFIFGYGNGYARAILKWF